MQFNDWAFRVSRNGWIYCVGILFMLFSIYDAVWRAEMSKYEAYWLKGFPLIIINS